MSLHENTDSDVSQISPSMVIVSTLLKLLQTSLVWGPDIPSLRKLFLLNEKYRHWGWWMWLFHVAQFSWPSLLSTDFSFFGLLSSSFHLRKKDLLFILRGFLQPQQLPVTCSYRSIVLHNDVARLLLLLVLPSVTSDCCFFFLLNFSS